MDVCILFNIAICIQVGGLLLAAFFDDLFREDIRKAVKNFGVYCLFGGALAACLIAVIGDWRQVCLLNY